MQKFRNGQWVTFVGNLPGAHTHDGRVVGIHYNEQRVRGALSLSSTEGDPVELQAGHEYEPASVTVVRPDGNNLMRLSDDGNSVVTVKFHPDELIGLTPLLDVAGIPEPRRPADPSYRLNP